MEDAVVASIRRNHGFDTNAPYAIDDPLLALRGKLERALERLSSDLYNKKTHFLLEFIQNADDNEYASDVVPALELRVEDRKVVFQCNEVGFTPANVKAICDIGASTKTAARGFIGEKGIGFKSVFTVADEVHISSAGFQFKFDRSQPLGMITPIPDTTYPVKQKWTSFHLHLSPSEDGAQLSVPLSEVRPTLLLFLRQLRSLTILVAVNGRRNRISIQRNDADDNVVTLFRVENKVMSVDRYIMVKHMAKTPQSEPKREGVTESEIVLAFPISDKDEPVITIQEVHAFLPLRTYGFSFIIQADLLTSASREDVLSDLAWNISLRSSIVDAFMAAVDRFKENATLRDVWFRYLPLGVTDSFFGWIEQTLFARLRLRQIFRGSDEVYHTPSKVLILPVHLCDDDGQAIIPEEYLPSGLHYLAPEYDVSRDGLLFARLGMIGMSDELFVASLSTMIQRDKLRHQTDDWHATVCERLYHMRNGHTHVYRPDVLALRILPLKDGSWAPAMQARTFLFDIEHMNVPDDLDIQTIIPGVEKSLNRFRFYMALGVAPANPLFVASKILAVSEPKSVESLVQYAKFFFDHRAFRPTLPSATQLRVMDQHGLLGQAEDLYLDYPLHPASLGNLRDVMSPSARFLHPAYLEAYGEDQKTEWVNWLLGRVGLNIYPRVVNGCLAPEFTDIAATLDSEKFLLVLKSFWLVVGSKISEDGLRQLGQLSVECTDGTRQCLNTTYLHRGILKRHHNLHFVPVADPGSRDWNFLEQIGVALRMDASFYINVLRRMQENGDRDVEAAEDVYRQLYLRFDEDENLIRSAFTDDPLILVKIKDGADTAWFRRLGGVYWHGPSSITSKAIISGTYRDLKDFFYTKLGIGDAPPYELADEIRALIKKHQGKPISNEVQERMTRLLVDLSDEISNPGPIHASFLTLKGQPMFPVQVPSGGFALQFIEQFYVPDKMGKYADVFRRRISLLMLAAPTSIARVRPLLDSDMFGPRVRYLETCVDRHCVPQGKKILDQRITEQYAVRVTHIARLVYHERHTEPSQRQIDFLRKLKNIAVWGVQSITTTLSLGKIKEITDDDVAIEDMPDRFTVYIGRNRRSSKSVDLRICDAISHALEIDVLRLFTCISQPFDMLDDILRLSGIEELEANSRHDRSWLQEISNSPPEPVAPINTRLNAPEQPSQLTPSLSPSFLPPSRSASVAPSQSVSVTPSPSVSLVPSHSVSVALPQSVFVAPSEAVSLESPNAFSDSISSAPSDAVFFAASRSVSVTPSQSVSVANSSFASSVNSQSFFSTSSIPSAISLTTPSPTPPRSTAGMPRNGVNGVHGASLDRPPSDRWDGSMRSMMPSNLQEARSFYSESERGSFADGRSDGYSRDETPTRRRGRAPSGVNAVMDNLENVSNSGLSFGSLGNLVSQAELVPSRTQTPPIPRAEPPLQEITGRPFTPVNGGGFGGPLVAPTPSQYLAAPFSPSGIRRPSSAAGVMPMLSLPSQEDIRRPSSANSMYPTAVIQPVVLMSPSTSRGPGQFTMDYNAPPSEETNSIGITGELYVFRMLKNALGLSFGPENWTSELRGQVPGFRPYTGKGLADFTYKDVYGTLTAHWYGMAKRHAWINRWPTFHIEVKATSGFDNEPFHMSRRQMNTALILANRGTNEVPTDVFVVVRVSGIGSRNTSVRLYTDPHTALSSGRLLVASDLFLQQAQ